MIEVSTMFAGFLLVWELYHFRITLAAFREWGGGKRSDGAVYGILMMIIHIGIAMYVLSKLVNH